MDAPPAVPTPPGSAPRPEAMKTRFDVRVLPDSYLYVVDMPGLEPGEIKITVDERDKLVVFGQRKGEADDDKQAEYLHVTRMAGQFMCQFQLLAGANRDAISARYHSGVLTVTVGKLEPKQLKNIAVVFD